MHPDLKKRFDALEGRRKAIVKRVRALPEEKRQAKASPGDFSPVEVIMHLALAEDSNISFLVRNPPAALKHQKPKTTFIFKRVVASLQNPRKRLPAAPFMVPKGVVNLDEADQLWSQVRKQSATYLEQAVNPEAAFIKFMFFFGVGSASDYLDLHEAHMTYHEERFPKV